MWSALATIFDRSFFVRPRASKARISKSTVTLESPASIFALSYCFMRLLHASMVDVGVF